MAESTVKTNAIVIRSKHSGENDRTLTLLSAELGTLTVIAKGVRSLKHNSRAGVMPLSYSTFILKKLKDGLYSLQSADLIEGFHTLSEDVILLSYGSYFADLCRMTVQGGIDAGEEVRLLLNTLHVLTRRAGSAALIKVVYEIKLMEIFGITPDFSPECPCGASGEYFSLCDGEMRCNEHHDEECVKILPAALKLASYISQSSLKDALYCEYDMSAAHSLSPVLEKFLKYHLGNLPNSLDYLKKILEIS